MKKTRKILFTTLALLSIGFACMGFASCSELAVGEKGDKGEQGIQGEKGENGVDGVSVTNASMDENGHLILTLSNGQILDCGLVKGADGAQGETGPQGSQGNKGDKGDKGEQGVSIEKVEFDEEGNLFVTFTDGRTQTIEVPKKGQEESLRFQKIEGKEEYRVMGIGNVSDLEIVIPETYKGLPVTEIGKEAFANEYYITSVVIPDSVTMVDSSAFNNCTSLTSFTGPTIAISSIPKSNFQTAVITSGDTIDYVAFANCSNLVSVKIPDSVETIGNHAFASCTSLTSVEIPDSVETIGDGAFVYCENLTSVVIGRGVETIGDEAFEKCVKLTSVVIPDSVTKIGRDVFYNCINLTSVVIGDSVKTIAERAFESCFNLMSVEIGDSVETISNSAFNGCNNLTSVVIGNSLKTIASYAFSNCSKLKIVYYKGTEEDWSGILVSDYWSNGSLTNAMRYYYSENEPTEEGNYWHYNENGEIVVW